MATRSSVLAWRIPGTEEPDGLPSMGSHGVGYDWSDLAEAEVAQMDTLIFVTNDNSSVLRNTSWNILKYQYFVYGIFSPLTYLGWVIKTWSCVHKGINSIFCQMSFSDYLAVSSTQPVLQTRPPVSAPSCSGPHPHPHLLPLVKIVVKNTT